MANLIKILNFTFCVTLMAVNVNAQSHMWLVAPEAWAGLAEGMVGQIVQFSVLGLPQGPERV